MRVPGESLILTARFCN